MTEAATNRCARHADRAASVLCVRCGDFACEECAQRLTPAAKPLCDACWRQRERAARALSAADHRVVRAKWIGAGALLLGWMLLVAVTFLAR